MVADVGASSPVGGDRGVGVSDVMVADVGAAGPDAGEGVAGLQGLMLRAIEAYQRAFEGRPSPCRFFPSCSEYGHEAITTHGARRGLWLTVRRLSRCRPFGPSGYDPVPLPRGVEPAHSHAPTTEEHC